MVKKSSPPGPSSVDSACSVESHDRIKASPKKFEECAYVGYQSDGMPGGTTYEVRNCPRCGSSLMKAVEVLKRRFLRSPRPAQLAEERGAA